MAMDPDALLADPAVNAAVDALAARNAHHLEGMNEQERSQAIAHWRELAVDVLAAARAALDAPAEGTAAAAAPDTPGRAVIVLEDMGNEDISVHLAFHPELEDLGQGEIAGTPAQILALSLMDQLEGSEDEPPTMQ